MNRLLTYNTIDNRYWYQQGQDKFTVGQIPSSLALDMLIKNARSDGATILNTDGIAPETALRLVKKYFNGRGYVDDVEEYIEALRLNGAKDE